MDKGWSWRKAANAPSVRVRISKSQPVPKPNLAIVFLLSESRLVVLKRCLGFEATGSILSKNLKKQAGEVHTGVWDIKGWKGGDAALTFKAPWVFWVWIKSPFNNTRFSNDYNSLEKKKKKTTQFKFHLKLMVRIALYHCCPVSCSLKVCSYLFVAMWCSLCDHSFIIWNKNVN